MTVRPLLHPAVTAAALGVAATAGAALAATGHSTAAVLLLALVAGTAAGFANSGST